MNDALIEQIRELAGSQRAASFALAAKWILVHSNDVNLIVETGSYRGNNGDGQSTLIFALLAKEVGCDFASIDISSEHSQKAVEHLTPELMKRVNPVVCDSVLYLSETMRPISVLYLDSLDYNDGDPMPCQIHQCCEIGAAFGKLDEHCLVMLDDNVEGTGGKTKLAAQFLESRGFKKLYNGYQLLFLR